MKKLRKEIGDKNLFRFVFTKKEERKVDIDRKVGVVHKDIYVKML